MEDDVSEGATTDIVVPIFGAKMAKLEKRYRRLRAFFAAQDFLFKNKEAYLINFLVKLRSMVDSTLVEPIMRLHLYTASRDAVVARLTEKHPRDRNFLAMFGSGLIFTTYLDRLRVAMRVSNDTIPDFDDMV